MRTVVGDCMAALFLGSLALSPAHAEAERCPTFTPRSQGLPTAVEWRTHPALGDVNGDGRLDIAGNPRKADHPHVWLARGDGTWNTASRGLVMPGSTCGVGVDFADVNEDGHLDLGVADHCNGLFVFLGDGKGGWSLGPSPMLGQRNKFESIRFGDLDKDGHSDLVAVASFRGGFLTRLGDGKGGWRKVASGLPRAGYGTDVELADVNGDGSLDVVAAFTPERESPTELDPRLDTVWLSVSPAKFEAASRNLPETGKYWDVAVGDVNGDGRADLAMTNDVGKGVPPISVYLGDGGKSWTLATKGLPEPRKPGSTTPAELFEGVKLRDVDGDGKTDLVAMNHLRAGISLWLGDGRGAWTPCGGTGLPETHAESRGWGVAVDDLNRDGRADIAAAFGRNGAGSVEVWLQK